MLYEATPDNLRLVVRTAGTLLRDQLLRFFSDTDDSLNVEYYIKELAAQRIFDYDDGKETVSWHTASRVTEAVAQAHTVEHRSVQFRIKTISARGNR